MWDKELHRICIASGLPSNDHITYMSGAHLHLLVNHAPVFGALFALALFAASFVWAPDVLRRTGLVVLVCTALAAVASDLSGDPAEHAIRGLPGVKRDLIHEHESMAGKALIVSEVVGVIALVLLIKQRRRPLGPVAGATGLVCSAIVSGAMAYTALLGGRIRHTEVRPNATPADAAAIESLPPRRGAAAPGTPP